MIDPSSLRLTLIAESTDAAGNGLTAPIATTVRHDGSFEFPAVIPGRYRIEAATSGAWWLRSAMQQGSDALDTGLEVATTDVALTLMLSDRRPSIAGTLTQATGRPATDYAIVAFSEHRAHWRAGSRRVRSVRPATNGAFELRDMPPGAYFLAALTDIDPADLADATLLESIAQHAIKVEVREGERTVQDVRIAGLLAGPDDLLDLLNRPWRFD